MNDKIELLLRAIVIGAGATLVMDGWALFLRQVGIPSLNFALLGRWIGHLPEGRWTLAKDAPVRGETAIGWIAHYSIGITFALLLLGVFGIEWARSPSLFPALAIGLVTVVAPIFILQPALGLKLNYVKSLATHTVYGFGLYAAAIATSVLFPAGGR